MGCASSKKLTKCIEPQEYFTAPSKDLSQSLSRDPFDTETNKGKDRSGMNSELQVGNQTVAPVAELFSAPKGPPQKAPLALLPKKQLLSAQEDEAVLPEAPAKNAHKWRVPVEASPKPPTSKASRILPSVSEPTLPTVKNISAVKSSFDKRKYQEANPVRGLPSLPASVEERLEEIQLFGTVPETGDKPISTLMLTRNSTDCRGLEGRRK